MVGASCASLVPSAPGDEHSERDTEAKGDADGLVRMVPDNLIGGFCSFDRFLLNILPCLFALFDCGRQPFAGFGNFFAGNVGGCHKQRLGIFGQALDVVTGGIGGFFHKNLQLWISIYGEEIP